jgi:5'-3' exonuclease
VAKDGSEEIPALLAAQIPLLLQVLQAFGLACAGADGFEADDVIATLAHRDTDAVEVVSGDRDLLALASERITVLYTGKGIAKLEAMGPAQVLAKYGVPAENYADFAVLRGDPSDGLPGVPGIGEKTAAALVNRFGQIEEIVAAAQSGDDGFPAGAAGKVRAAIEYLAVAPAAVRGRIDVPLDVIDDALYAEPRDVDQLNELAENLGIRASVDRLLKAVANAAGQRTT